MVTAMVDPYNMWTRRGKEHTVDLVVHKNLGDEEEEEKEEDEE